VLGHLVQDGSILPDEQKTSAIANWPVPRTKKQLKRYLGLTSYFRGFIRDYAGIARPLTELLRKRKSDRLNWGPEEQRSFDQLKEALKNKPVLRPPDFAKDYVTMCDVSKLSVSGLLMQRESDENSQLYVVCYASRKL